MLRGFVVIVSALAAVSARAQDAQALKTADGGRIAVAEGGRDRVVVLASRTTPEPRPSPLTRSARPDSPNGGADAGTREGPPNETADCSIVQTFRGGTTPAVRNYQSPSSDSQGQVNEERPPFVASVAHCGQRYIFQVKSSTRDAWVIKGARLEGPNGELLRVIALTFDALQDGWSVNVIVADAPLGVKVSKLKLHLTGQDGRVAQPEARDLP